MPETQASTKASNNGKDNKSPTKNGKRGCGNSEPKCEPTVDCEHYGVKVYNEKESDHHVDAPTVNRSHVRRSASAKRGQDKGPDEGSGDEEHERKVKRVKVENDV
jgi:hypothetical protein